METAISNGGSGGLKLESFWKKTKEGNSKRGCKNTPAEAAVSKN
jgi:hypothetical protein